MNFPCVFPTYFLSTVSFSIAKAREGFIGALDGRILLGKTGALLGLGRDFEGGASSSSSSVFLFDGFTIASSTIRSFFPPPPPGPFLSLLLVDIGAAAALAFGGTTISSAATLIFFPTPPPPPPGPRLSLSLMGAIAGCLGLGTGTICWELALLLAGGGLNCETTASACMRALIPGSTGPCC
jgi:hypothetical protein